MSAGDLLAGVTVGCYVILEDLIGGTWRRVEGAVAARVAHVTRTQISLGGSSRYRRSDGARIPRDYGGLRRARPETAEERADREARTSATRTICETLRLGGPAALRTLDLSHMSTPRLVAIAAACVEPVTKQEAQP